MGRPSTYTPEIGWQICELLAAGKSLLEICENEGMPHEHTVRQWAIRDEGGFFAEYSRARDIGVDHEVDEIKVLADRCRIGEKTERKELGRSCSLCGRPARWVSRWRHAEDLSDLCQGAEAEKVVEEKVTSGDMVERSKLQILARQWRASRMAPKRYSDRLELAGDKDAPLTITVRRKDRE